MALAHPTHHAYILTGSKASRCRTHVLEHNCVLALCVLALCVWALCQDHVYVYDVYTVFLAGKPPNIWSYTVLIYGPGRPYLESISNPFFILLRLLDSESTYWGCRLRVNVLRLVDSESTCWGSSTQSQRVTSWALQLNIFQYVLTRRAG
jgi:hypothetical protein